MSAKRPTTPPPEALNRAALINGTLTPTTNHQPQTNNPPDFFRLTERFGVRYLRLSSISQVINDTGSIGGPWFIRCDSQQLPVSEIAAREISALLGCKFNV
jgi:hypothetical protein